MRLGRHARLYADDELHVLWLSAGRSELALSTDGMWLRRGRRSVELTWSEIEQVQTTPIRVVRRGRNVRLEVFRRDGRVQAFGPFPAPLAHRWLAASAAAAEEHGETPLPLDGAPGFALRESRPASVSS